MVSIELRYEIVFVTTVKVWYVFSMLTALNFLEVVNDLDLWPRLDLVVRFKIWPGLMWVLVLHQATAAGDLAEFSVGAVSTEFSVWRGAMIWGLWHWWFGFLIKFWFLGLWRYPKDLLLKLNFYDDFWNLKNLLKF